MVSLVVLSLIVGGVAGGVAGALTARILSDGELEETAAPVGIATPTSGSAVSLSEESAITEAVGKALPSVVAIVSEEATLPGEDQQPVALGSGVIIDERGYIVTNEHVVRDATSVRVALYGGEERQATVVGHDSPFTDLAVLKIPSGGLSPMSVGDSDALVSGQRVIAVGNPLHDFRSSVSVGVVSGVQRRWQRDGIFMEDLIQTDAAVNPGNSGGALIDVLGQLVGMPTSVVRSDNGRDVEGIALAISSKTIREVAGEIIEQGRVRRAYLGVSHIDLTPEVAAARGLREQRGAWISSVGEGTPAAQAGIEVGDIILRMGGQDVTASAPFLNVLMGLQPDETVPVVLSRDGQQLTVDVTPIQRPQRP
ncbi:MAG: trypsin-like peptidase domain-containing protein [Chloroflexota bacterium]|nr:trypsin-like peptidase domain-containing protein [Chloroflexota bacterium]